MEVRQTDGIQTESEPWVLGAKKVLACIVWGQRWDWKFRYRSVKTSYDKGRSLNFIVAVRGNHWRVSSRKVAWSKLHFGEMALMAVWKTEWGRGGKEQDPRRRDCRTAKTEVRWDGRPDLFNESMGGIKERDYFCFLLGTTCNMWLLFGSWFKPTNCKEKTWKTEF